NAYKIHKSKFEKCQFCGGELERNIYEKIDNHFSKESELLEGEIDQQLKVLAVLKEKIINFKITSEMFSTAHQPAVENVKLTLEGYKRNIQREIEYIIKELQARKSNLFLSKDTLELKLDVSIDLLNEQLRGIVI